jgi:hypothetical protein
MKSPTEHVPPLVLASALVSNVRLDAQVDKGQVFDVVVFGIDASDNAEPFAGIHIVAEPAKLVSQGREWEVGRGQIASIQLKACRKVLDSCTTERVRRA